MGKVKCEADAPIGTGFDVSIPYGKGKEDEFRSPMTTKSINPLWER